jgi:hypothetical protein
VLSEFCKVGSLSALNYVAAFTRRWRAAKEGQIMKGLRFLVILLVGLGVTLAPGAVTSFARHDPPFQGRGNEGEGHGRGNQGHEKENRGKHKGWERNREGRYQFNNEDRQVVDNYYREHRNERFEPGPRGYALGYGQVIEQRYRRYCRPAPVVLVREMPPPPPGFRYFLFGGNVVLLDGGYRVHDFIHIGINIGR